MGKNINDRYRSSLISSEARDSAKNYQREHLKARRKKDEGFFDKSLDYRNYIFSPEGYEGIVMALYFFLIPYALGLLFLFIFVAETSFEYFLEFDLASILVIWAIGYEVCAVLILIVIFLAWLGHSTNKEQPKPPRNNRYGY